MKIIYGVLFLYITMSFSSCVSYESLLNYNEGAQIPTQVKVINNFAPIKIQSGDKLQIRVLSNDALTTKPFSISSNNEAESGGTQDNYLVSSTGNIDFPTLGEIEVKGLAIEEVKEKILTLLSPYFEQDPILQVDIANFRISINGEVSKPGLFAISNDRVTIIEAVTMAGDFTTYSRRDSILIIREQDGMRSFGYVNFNSSDIFNSPYFYLQQNDAIYVQPTKTKTSSIRDPSSRFLPYVTTFVSLAALIITIVR